MIAKQTSNVVPLGRAGDQTNGRVENGLQALNVAVGETSEYIVTVVKPTVYQAVTRVVSACPGKDRS